MSNMTNKFSPEVRERAVRIVGDHRADYGSEWAAMTSIAGKIGCIPPAAAEANYYAASNNLDMVI